MFEYKKLSSWIDLLIIIIKPKFHNTISKIIILYGLSLIIESQTSIFQLVLIHFSELIFDDSTFIEKLFSGDSNPNYGLILVGMGLLYNAIVTVGLDIAKQYKAIIPIKPNFQLKVLNADKDEIGDKYQMRGSICTHLIDSIPDNTSFPSDSKISNNLNNAFANLAFHDPFAPTPNKDFYRERDTLLRTWGGSELLYFSIENIGSALAKNVRVVISFDSDNTLSTTCTNDIYPKLPKQEKIKSPSLFPQIDNIPNIKGLNKQSNHIFEWGVGNLQAKECFFNSTKIFLKNLSETKMIIKVYCDELSDPIYIEKTISPTILKFEFDLNTLMQDDKDFLKLANNLIMDGYMKRTAMKNVEEIENQDNQLIP